MKKAEIAIVGAGVIGLAIAHRLAREGREVVLIDPAPPGSGASYGNAGTVADYAVSPVGTPSVLKNLPSLLLNRNSPLSIRHAALASLAPWLLRFARQSLPAAARRNALALADILADAAPLWRDLAAEIGATPLLRENGALYLYDTPHAFRAAEAEIAERRELGVAVKMITAAEVASLEARLPPMAGGALFPNAIFMTDPGQMMDLLAKAAIAAGAEVIEARVDRLTRQDDGVLLTGAGLRLTAKHVVIAAGAHSRALARQAGDRIPLDTERGYHIEWDMPEPLLCRPTSPVARGFYLCPMQGRLRAAGTVELGGLTAPPSPHRIARLVEGARTIFPDLGPPDRTWMGFRPSLPDSLPVIGPSQGGDDVILAFGHGHIGLTLAPATARIVSGQIAGRLANTASSPFAPHRFRK